MARLSRASRWIAPAGAAVAFANLATLGLLIGWNGASRAYGRLDTLFRDHGAAVVVALGIALVLAFLAGRRAGSRAEVVLVAAAVLAADVVAGLLVAAGIGELTFWDLPSIVFVETAGGTQLVAAGIGLVAGYTLGRRAGEPEISAGS